MSPPQPLTYGVDTLAAQINGLPVDRRDETCTLQGSLYNFRLTFQYPDAEPVQVVADLGGCGTLWVRGESAGTIRSGPDLVLTTYLEELVRQRRIHPTPLPEPPRVRCALPGREPPSLLPKTAPLRLVAVRLCAFDRGGDLARDISLTTEQLALVARDDTAHVVSKAPRHSSTVLGSPADPPMSWILVGQSRWGDRVVMYGWSGYFYRWGGFLDEHPAWVPSPPIRSLLAHLTAS